MYLVNIPFTSGIIPYLGTPTTDTLSTNYSKTFEQASTPKISHSYEIF